MMTWQPTSRKEKEEASGTRTLRQVVVAVDRLNNIYKSKQARLGPHPHVIMQCVKNHISHHHSKLLKDA